MPSVGSSSSRSFGRVISARAIEKLLLLAARQIAAAAVAHVLEHRKQLVDMVRDPVLAARQTGKSGLQILGHRQERKDIPALRHIADAPGGQLMRRDPADRLPVEMIVATRAVMHPGDRLEQAGLAHAIGAHHAGHLPDIGFQRNALEDL